MKNQNLIEFGYCEKAHGVKGGMDLRIHNIDESFLETKPIVTLKPKEHRHKKSNLPPQGKDYKIKSITFGHKVILYLEGVESMNDVEAIIPFSLLIDENKLPELDDDEIYIKDLFGLDVYDYSTDQKIGIVSAVYDNGIQFILSVKQENGEVFDVPYVDNFVKSTNLDDKKISIVKPEWIE